MLSGVRQLAATPTSALKTTGSHSIVYRRWQQCCSDLIHTMHPIWVQDLMKPNCTCIRLLGPAKRLLRRR